MTMRPIQFGISSAAAVPAPQIVDMARLAEGLGFDVFWIFDSHLAGREAMALLGALAVSTQRIQLGPGVSHLAGRHPSVIASAMATLNELAPNRIRLGIGVGDTGPLNLGVPRTSLADLESAIVSIRGLLQGQRVEGPSPEKKLRLSYADERSPVPPIYVAGSGARTHRLAGRVADGALISGLPDELPAAVQSVRAGEQEAGRPAGSTRILLWTTAAVDADGAAARAATRGSVGRRALNSWGHLARRGQLPAEDAQILERLQAAHDAGRDEDYLSLVPERWIDRFTIAGTPDEVQRRLRQGVQDGADEISVILMQPGGGGRSSSAEMLTRFAETVMHPLQAAWRATA